MRRRTQSTPTHVHEQRFVTLDDRKWRRRVVFVCLCAVQPANRNCMQNITLCWSHTRHSPLTLNYTYQHKRSSLLALLTRSSSRIISAMPGLISMSSGWLGNDIDDSDAGSIGDGIGKVGPTPPPALPPPDPCWLALGVVGVFECRVAFEEDGPAAFAAAAAAAAAAATATGLML